MPQNDFMLSVYGPLGIEYCDYFYYLSVINIIFLVYIILAGLYTLLFDKKKDGIFTILLIALPTFVGYFTNRLMYSMCVGSTQR
jgi:phosphoglycerol transferase MdoB-like AlkP superfamily enzyme